MQNISSIFSRLCKTFPTSSRGYEKHFLPLLHVMQNISYLFSRLCKTFPTSSPRYAKHFLPLLQVMQNISYLFSRSKSWCRFVQLSIAQSALYPVHYCYCGGVIIPSRVRTLHSYGLTWYSLHAVMQLYNYSSLAYCQYYSRLWEIKSQINLPFIDFLDCLLINHISQ